MGCPDGNIEKDVETANLAMGMLATRSGLRHAPVFSPQAHHHDDVEQVFSTEQVMEAGARLAELFMMAQFDESKEAIATWRRQYIQGDYLPVFDLLERELSPVMRDPAQLAMAGKSIVDMALCAPIDHVCSQMYHNPISFFDVHPGARVHRLARAAARILAKSEEMLSGSTLEEICEEARLPSLGETLRIASEGVIQHEANWGGHIQNAAEAAAAGGINEFWNILRRGVDDSPTADFVKLYETLYRGAFRMRAMRPDLFAIPAGQGTGLTPIIEWFSDSCAFNTIDQLKQQWLNLENLKLEAIHAKAFFHMVDHVVALSLIGRVSYEDVKKLDIKFRARVRRDYVHDPIGWPVGTAEFLSTSWVESGLVFFPRSARKLLLA
jgi:hypothetical protein